MWVVRKNYIDNVIGFNTHFNEETKEFELWITKINNKTMKIASDCDEVVITNLVNKMKSAIYEDKNYVEVV